MVINSCAMTGVHAKRKKGVRWEMGLTGRPKSYSLIKADAAASLQATYSFTKAICGVFGSSSKPPAKAR